MAYILIKNHINDAYIYVCDIISDYILNNIPLHNPNVMLELEYALDKFNKNIILISNAKITQIIS